MKLLFVFLATTCCFVSSAQAQNPTRLWELRDSLQILSHDSTYGELANALLGEIQGYNKRLSRVLEVIPTPHLRIDVCSTVCEGVGQTCRDLRERPYDCIAFECDDDHLWNEISMQQPNAVRIEVSEPLLRSCAHVFSGSDIPKVRYIAYLVRCVQSEIALLELTFALRERRSFIGDEITGLLMVDFYYVPDHIRHILKLFNARSNLLN